MSDSDAGPVKIRPSLKKRKITSERDVLTGPRKEISHKVPTTRYSHKYMRYPFLNTYTIPKKEEQKSLEVKGPLEKAHKVPTASLSYKGNINEQPKNPVPKIHVKTDSDAAPMKICWPISNKKKQVSSERYEMTDVAGSSNDLPQKVREIDSFVPGNQKYRHMTRFFVKKLTVWQTTQLENMELAELIADHSARLEKASRRHKKRQEKRDAFYRQMKVLDRRRLYFTCVSRAMDSISPLADGFNEGVESSNKQMPGAYKSVFIERQAYSGKDATLQEKECIYQADTVPLPTGEQNITPHSLTLEQRNALFNEALKKELRGRFSYNHYSEGFATLSDTGSDSDSEDYKLFSEYGHGPPIPIRPVTK